MSDAVTATGILVSRGAMSAPSSTAITGVSVADPTVITAVAHGLSKGDDVLLALLGTTPSINGRQYVLAVVDDDHFTIDVAVTVVSDVVGTVQQIFAVVGELTDVGPGGKSRNKIETSTHNEGSESHLLGILRQEDPTMKINYVGTDLTHVAIQADIDNNVKNHWKIRYPSGVARSGDAYVQMFKYDDAPVDAKQGASLAITWAGVVTEIAS